MLVTDAHSGWPEIIEMASATSTKTIDELRHLFEPEQVVTDNGPQFVSKSLQIVKLNGIKHMKTSPNHQVSSGAVERLVQRSKMSKIVKGITISLMLFSFLLSYRTTPHSTTNVMPELHLI